MAVDGTGPARLFCPVAGCPCGDPLQARGWASPATMQSHVDAHLAGTLAGQVPQNWLDSAAAALPHLDARRYLGQPNPDLAAHSWTGKALLGQVLTSPWPW